MAIATPATAQKVEDFTPTQIELIKSSWELWSRDVLTSVKTSTNHKLTIDLYENALFTCVSDGSIFDGDTIESLDATVYTIKFINTSYIPAYWRYEINIVGSIAYVNLAIHVNLTIGLLVSKFGSFGTGDGQFGTTSSISASGNYIYVLDLSKYAVQIFDLNGVFVSKFGSNGTGDGQFQTPTSISVSGNYIYVLDSTRDDVQIFDLNGVFVSKFGSTGTGDGQFINPTCIITTKTSIYVIDAQRDDVQIFDLNSIFISKFGNEGTGDGQFKTPIAISASSDYIYILDQFNYNIQIFK